MIKEIKMFTIICDNCGKDVCDGEEFSCWNDEGYVKDCASDADWVEHNNGDYCPNCYEYDDNDELIFKTKTK